MSTKDAGILGFPLRYNMHAWGSFVESGELARTLVGMCHLAIPLFPLSFVLESASVEDGVVIRFVVREEKVEVRVGAERWNEGADEELEAIFGDLNPALGAEGIAPRFAIVRATRAEQVDFSHRIVLEPESFDESAPIRTPASLQTPEKSIPTDRRFMVDLNYPDLLAAYVERLAAFVNLRSMTCVPTPSKSKMFVDKDFFTLRVTWKHSSGGSLQETVRIDLRPELDLQPIFDCVNRQLESADRGERLYRFARISSGEGAVLATGEEAERLRSAGHLIERRQARDVLERLKDVGLQLPYMSGYSVSVVRGKSIPATHLYAILTQICLLASVRFSLTFVIEGEAVHDPEKALPNHVAFEIEGKSTRVAWPPHSERKNFIDAFVLLVRALNELCARANIDDRFVMMTGDPVWYGHRLFLLPRAWVSQVLTLKEAFAECLEPTFVAHKVLPYLHQFPPETIEENFPRIDRIDEIVPEKRILESDFKSSARPTDYFDLLEQIAQFAELDVRGVPPAVEGERAKYYDLTARFEGHSAIVRIANDKYPDVTPMVDYLNRLLAARGADHRLYRFRGGYFLCGVLLANEEEVMRLRRAAYIAPE